MERLPVAVGRLMACGRSPLYEGVDPLSNLPSVSPYRWAAIRRGAMWLRSSRPKARTATAPRRRRGQVNTDLPLMVAAVMLCAGFAIPAWAGSAGATASVTSGVSTTVGTTVSGPSANASANGHAVNQGFASGSGTISAGGNTSAIAVETDLSTVKVTAKASGGSTAKVGAKGSGTAEASGWSSQ